MSSRTGRPSVLCVLALTVLTVLTAAGCATTADDSAVTQPEPTVYSKEIVSKNHTIDQVYLSMEGPTDTQTFSLLDTPERELVWLTSTRVEILDGAGNKTSDEHLCHSNLYFSDFKEHHLRFDRTITADQKFVDVNQGLTTVQFPEGFGFPVFSNEPLVFHSMVISPVYDGSPFDLAVRTTFEFLRDTELEGKIKPLSQRGVQLRIPVGNYDGDRQPMANPEACSPEHETHADHIGKLADSATEKVFTQTDIQTRFEGAHGVDHPETVYSIHWMVPPGRHEYRHVIHEGLRIPYDETTIHVVTGHLHPYGESIELRDATENKSLFKARAETAEDRVALTLLEAYTSAEGFPVYSDHQYEIVSVYDNTTDHDVDAMAVLYLYFYEKSFDRARINLK